MAKKNSAEGSDAALRSTLTLLVPALGGSHYLGVYYPKSLLLGRGRGSMKNASLSLPLTLPTSRVSILGGHILSACRMSPASDSAKQIEDKYNTKNN